MTDDEIIKVVQAHKDNKPIQSRLKGTQEWCDIHGQPRWDFANNDYREKPPEPLECWVNVYEDGGQTVHKTQEEADSYKSRIRCVHVREVLE